jgi:hypothetical protein
MKVKAALEAFDRRVAEWEKSDRLSGNLAAQVRALIAADRMGLLGWALPEVSNKRPDSGGERPGAEGGDTHSTQQVAEALEATPSTDVNGLPSPNAPLPTPGSASQLRSALMALATRRTLLFLGSFLLAVSALTLVLFNWASFPPTVQIGILAALVLRPSILVELNKIGYPGWSDEGLPLRSQP